MAIIQKSLSFILPQRLLNLFGSKQPLSYFASLPLNYLLVNQSRPAPSLMLVRRYYYHARPHVERVPKLLAVE